MLTVIAFGATIVETGKCGENVTYTLDSDGLLTISGEGDMAEYDWGESPFFVQDGIKTVVIENGVTSIGGSAFYGCTGLTSIVIPDSVTSIGDQAFYDCTGLTSIVIPDSVTGIGDYAFENCINLKNITLSKNLVTLGSGTFAYTAIESVEIPRTMDSAMFWYRCDYEFGGSYISIPDGPFYCCENLKNVTFEEGVTEISDTLFAGCTGLEKITIPDTVTTIESSAFEGCVRLVEVKLSGNITLIDASAFRNCASLTDITIPNTVTDIENSVFEGCSSLESAKLPVAMQTISQEMFRNCKSLKTIEIPSTVTEIWDSAFKECASLESYTFENGKTSLITIGSGAFSDCTSLKTANIPDTVKTIRENAYNNCTSLSSVEIPASVSSLGNCAFQNDTALESVKLNGTHTSIGPETFRGCESLKNIEFTDYTLETIDESAFMDIPALEEVVLPKGLTTINAQAFRNDTSLTSVVIPVSVTSIAKDAFSYSELTVIKGVAGSAAQTYANENRFKFEDISKPADGIALLDGVENITLDVGETFNAEFEVYPEDSSDIITLSASSSSVEITQHRVKGSYAGDCVVTATATSGTEYPFNVHVRAVSKIVVKQQPSKLSYIMGEEFDPAGLKVGVQYGDKSTKEVTDYTISGFDSSVEGTNTVTVNWRDANENTYETTFSVNIIDPRPKVTGIEIASQPAKINYQLKESLDLTGLVVKASYSDGAKQSVTGYTVSGYNALKNGEQTVTVTYNGFTASFKVYVGTAHTHTYDSGKVTKTATLTSAGTITYTCTGCPATTTENIAKIQSVTLAKTSYTYSGSVITPAVTVKDSAGKTLVKDTDYTVAYSSGRKAAGSYTATVTFIGKYSGTSPAKTFTIAKQALSASLVTLSKTSFTFNSAVQKPTVTVKNAAGTTLTEGTSYTAAYSSGSKYPGTYTVTLTGTGNYTGTVTKTYKINAQTLTKTGVTLSATGFQYNATTRKPTVTVKNAAGTVLTEGTSYTVSYESGWKIGTYSVTITGKGNYTGTVTKNYYIVAQTIKPENVTLSASAYQYNATTRKPTVTVKSNTGTVLTEGVSYKLTYNSGWKIGTYSVTVTGIGNYSGTITKTYQIVAQKLKAENITLSATSYTYNGAVHKPTVKVKSNTGTVLTEGTSYKVTYSSGCKAKGTYNVTITGIGNYSGTIVKTFTIK